MTVKAILDTDILPPDCLIAAVAVRLNRPLVTGNTDHFATIQTTGINLTIENWR